MVVAHCIDGRFLLSQDGATMPSLDPAGGEVLAEVAAGGSADVDAAVGAAARAFAEEEWAYAPAKRRQALLRLADLMDSQASELAELESRDTGIPIRQTLRAQLPRAAENFRFFSGLVEGPPEQAFPQDGDFLNYTQRRPVGVAALITPWNTPLMLETWKLAPCLASGNTCVLKPAEWSPLTAERLAGLALEAGVPPGVFNVVNGVGEVAGAALVAHPSVRLISFTGETTTGEEIVRNGAAGLKRYSLELGGKSPVLVFADADLDRALDAAVFGNYSLNGERCTAGSRVLVEDSVAASFEEALAERVGGLRVGPPLEETTEVGPLIHPQHLARVADYVRLGQEEGAQLAVGGDLLEGPGNYLRPALFTGVRNEMRIAQEEIFGPVMCVQRFHDEEEAVRLANDVRYGLAAYLWTADSARAHRVAGRMEAGMVWVNSQNVRDLRTPFGGSKQSGMGREGGWYSWEFYTELRNVCVALGRHPIPKMGASPA